MDYEIDPLSTFSPDMDDAEFAALKASIAEIGQLVSIVAANGKIIDGRKRYQACTELGKTPSVIEIPIGADPAAHAIALNLLRTQYNGSQRAMYAAKVATRSRADSAKKSTPKSVMIVPTIKEAAKAAGVAQSTVIAAKAVRRDAIPQVISAVERGDLTVHSAFKIAKQHPKHEQSAALQTALAEPKGRDGRRTSSAASAGGRRPRMHRRGPAELAGNSIDVLNHAARELADAIVGLGDITNVERRLTQLDDVATTVRRARDILKRRISV